MKIRISTRVVFVFKRCVIKIPISYRGYLQCKNEKELWDKYSSTGLLGKMYWYRFGLVCMKRYRRATYKIPFIEINEVKKQIPELNIVNCDLHIIENWGYQQGNYYLIDYGINERISKMYN